METRRNQWLDKIKNNPAIIISQAALSDAWIVFISHVLEPTGAYNKDDCARLKKELPEGFCCGYSALKGYAERISKQPIRYDQQGKAIPRYDTEWFYRMLYVLATWDRNANSLSKNDREDLEEFLAQLNYFQNIEYYSYSSGQANLQNSLFDSLGRTVEKEYAIGALFTQVQLKQLLDENIIHENTLILIESGSHVINLAKDDNIYILLNPNSEKGEIAIAAEDNAKLAENIFIALKFKKENPSPVGFRMFQLPNLQNEMEEHIYPTQEYLYKKINLATNMSSGINYAGDVTPLIQASRVGDEASVRYLLQQGVNINAQKISGSTALHQAVYFHQPHIVNLLLAHHANSLLQNNLGNTPLMLAITASDITLVDVLLNADYPANLKIQNVKGVTPLMQALAKKRFDVIVAMLLKADEKEFQHILSLLDTSNYFDILGVLCSADHPELTEKLLHHLTAEQVKLLITNVIQDKNFALIKLICLNQSLMKNILYTVAKEGNLAIITYLINDLKVDINTKLPNGFATPLILAARYGHVDIVNYLLKSGAVLDAEDNDKDTALTLAALNGHYDIVKVLLSSGADIEHQDNLGNTALLLAIMKNHKAVFSLLIEHSANINIINHHGNGALVLSARMDDKEIFYHLMKKDNIQIYEAIFRNSDAFVNAYNSHHHNMALAACEFIFKNLHEKIISDIFYRALQEKQLFFIKHLLTKINIDAKNIIYQLAHEGNQAFISLLKQGGANTDILLYSAIKENKIEIANALIKMGFDIDLPLCVAAQRNEKEIVIELLQLIHQPISYALLVGIHKTYLPLIEIALKMASLDDIFKAFIFINEEKEQKQDKNTAIKLLFDGMPADLTSLVLYEAVKTGNGIYLENLFTSHPCFHQQFFSYRILCYALQKNDQATLLKFKTIKGLSLDDRGPDGSTALIYLMRNNGSATEIDFLLMNHTSVMMTNNYKESPHSLAIVLLKQNKLPMSLYIKIENLMLIENYIKEKEAAIKEGNFTTSDIFHSLKKFSLMKNFFEYTNQEELQIAVKLRERIANNESIALETFSSSEQAVLMQSPLKVLYQKLSQTNLPAAGVLRIKK